MKDLRIVIPAHDEEASIGEVIEHTQKKKRAKMQK
jgi:hypothetical protein